jgi:hypothetical protein
MAHRFAVARALRQHGLPQPPGLRVVAALARKHSQVALGQVAVDPLVQARELVRAPQRQNLPPALLSFGRLAPMPVDDTLAKQQFGVIRLDASPSAQVRRAASLSPVI